MESEKAQRVDVVVDRDGAILSIAATAEAESLARRLAVGEYLLSHAHEPDRAFLGHAFEWARANPSEEATLRVRVPRSNGRLTNVFATCRGEGDTVRVTLRPDEAALARRAERQMRQVVEGSAQGIVVRSHNELLFLNDGFAKMLGYSGAQELMAWGPERLNEVIYPADRQMVLERIRRRMAGEEVISHYELRLSHRDGSTVWADTLATFATWDGKPVSLSWLTDITARKHAEAELVKSKQAAEYANSAKSQFLATMSHELRTPLNAILGFSEVLTTEMLGPVGQPKYLEYAQDIHESGSHLLDLINDILDLAKLEAGKLDLHESEVSLENVIERCLSLTRDRAKRGKVVLETQVADNLAAIRCDERAVRQVMLNLLSNAIKFTPEGGVVSVCANFDAVRGFILSVSDTGIGMSQKEIEIA
ncbi:MAG TPA: histidine kinase dimerization/phospho-acceptor domain-containing protein, partial [Rhizomicrobium sp.]